MIIDFDKIRSELREHLETTGVSINSFSGGLGIEQASINRFLKGQQFGLSYPYIEKILPALGYKLVKADDLNPPLPPISPGCYQQHLRDVINTAIPTRFESPAALASYATVSVKRVVGFMEGKYESLNLKTVARLLEVLDMEICRKGKPVVAEPRDESAELATLRKLNAFMEKSIGFLEETNGLRKKENSQIAQKNTDLKRTIGRLMPKAEHIKRTKAQKPSEVIEFVGDFEELYKQAFGDDGLLSDPTTNVHQ
jgi:transcriptional regulator with XRE-family HTH domain